MAASLHKIDEIVQELAEVAGGYYGSYRQTMAFPAAVSDLE
jgi:hypothetical protein